LVPHLSLSSFLAALWPFWNSWAHCGNCHICTAVSQWRFERLLLFPFWFESVCDELYFDSPFTSREVLFDFVVMFLRFLGSLWQLSICTAVSQWRFELLLLFPFWLERVCDEPFFDTLFISGGSLLAALWPFWDSWAFCGNCHICTAVSKWRFGPLLLFPFLGMTNVVSMLHSILI
jgi:hypothetical protein